MWHALHMMSNFKRYNVTGKLYEAARTEHAKRVGANNKKYKTKPKEVREYSCEECDALVHRTEFCHHEPKPRVFCTTTCRNRYTSRHRPSRRGVSIHRTKPAWNKGISNPQSAINGKRGAAVLTVKATGRRMVKRDGQRTWSYPGDIDYPKK